MRDSELKKAIGVTTDRRDYPKEGHTSAVITCNQAAMQQVLGGMFEMVDSEKLTAEHASHVLKTLAGDLMLIETL